MNLAVLSKWIDHRTPAMVLYRIRGILKGLALVACLVDLAIYVEVFVFGDVNIKCV